MPITNPQAVKFSNERIRPAADAIASLFYLLEKLENDWFADNVNAVLTNTSDLITDGSATDGRTPITGADAVNIITQAQAISALLNGPGVLSVILKPAVNVKG